MDKRNIELKFYDLLRGNLNAHEFEKWVYEIDQELLNAHFGRGFYFELASLNYRNKYVLNELERLLFSKVPFGRYEEMKIREILTHVIEDSGDLVTLIEELYDLYCEGYNFLRYLGLAYVFHGTPGEHDSYIFSVHIRHSLQSEAKRILSFLEAKKIVITGEYAYDDLREYADKVELHSLDKMYVIPRRNILSRIIDRLAKLTIRPAGKKN